MLNLFFFLLALVLVIKSADFAIKYASHLAQVFSLPRYVVGFLVVAIISILPETFIAIASVFQGAPSFGLGMLFGSNVADLTLIFGLVVLTTANGIRIKSPLLENNQWYPLVLSLPIILGLDGFFSRVDGLILIVAGLLFYYLVFKMTRLAKAAAASYRYGGKKFFYLMLSLVALLIGSNLAVKYGIAFAESVNLNPILIGMLVVGLSTTLPELFFSVRAVKYRHEDLALGDILGTVISDATIVVGILALISPFAFPQKIVYVTAVFMVVASLVLFALMRSGKILTKKEGWLLFLYYAIFVLTEYFLNQ